MSTSGGFTSRPGAPAGPALDAPPATRPIQRVSTPRPGGSDNGGSPASAGGPAGTSTARPTGAAQPGAAKAKTTSGSGMPGAPRPGRPQRPAKPARPTVRRVRLAVTRIDPWSAMKMSFLLSFAAALGLVVMTAVLWMVLSGMSVFADVDGLIRDLQPSTTATPFSIMEYVAFPRVMALAMVIGVVDVILLTALGTIGAYLYNLSAALVGGVQLTLTDE